MRVSNLSDRELSSEEYEALVKRQAAEQIFDTLTDQIDRDTRIYHLMSQVDSMEKSIKDTNKKTTMIRNQIRKEKGRGEL